MADAEQYVSVGGHRLRLTNLDKVLYPETGTTKAEVIDYYTRVADVLIPHAKDRPATRKRWVHGVGTPDKPGQVFFQKNLDDGTPSWVKRRSIQHTDHVNEYPLVNDLPTLVWLAQIAALEIHVPQWRFGRNGARKNPDRLVLDLDPGEGAGLPECVEVAKIVRTVLRGMGLDPLPVTSGSKGIHLYAALDGKQSSDEVSAVAHELARMLEADHPDLVVSDQKKTLRGGKVLLDWSQNNGNKTTIVPYSLRGRFRPTVAAPRTWRELTSPGLAQLEFDEVLRRIEKKGDPLLELSVGHLGEDLGEYRSMRDPSKTPEPMGGGRATHHPGEPSFVIQEHHASRLHHDFRLERDGVLVSWALPKGVPTDRKVNHLAVKVEDHPLEYGSFEGVIPKGEYGAGRVEIWDRGTYDLEKWRDDEVIATLHGEKHGTHRYALIQTGGRTGDDADNWLIHLMAPAGEAGAATEPARRPAKRAEPLAPMLATAGDPDTLDRDEDWVFELKWDGIRALATISGDELTLRSRNGLDLTASYPELAELVPAFDGDGVVDGEIVALDAEGRPSFSRLQRRMGLTVPRDVERARRAIAVHYFAFDLLELDGRALVKEPYERRRELLREHLEDRGPIAVPPDVGTKLAPALDTSEELGLEGVMAKRRDSPYRVGRRSRDWIKLKHHRAQEVVIAGWRPGNGRRADTSSASSG